MKFVVDRLALACLVGCMLLAGAAQAQFKKILRADTTVLSFANNFWTGRVMETDLPGREIAVVGSLSAQDTTGWSRSELFVIMTDRNGAPSKTLMFEDTSAFLFLTPHVYGGCYDGNGEFYVGMGANNQQVVFKVDTAETLQWSKKGNHHEYYSLFCEGGSVAVMGQDESIQGGHDFSLARFDGQGGDGMGARLGSPDTDVPHRLARVGDGYALVGSAHASGTSDGLVVRANSNFELSWGNKFKLPGKSVQLTAVAGSGTGYIAGGIAINGGDSLVLVRLDAGGNPVWTRLVGIAGVSDCFLTDIVVHPTTGDYIVGGYYTGPLYYRTLAFRMDTLGNVVWARDYADTGTGTDEKITSMTYAESEDMVYACGDIVIVNNNYENAGLLLKFSADSGSIPCDTPLAVGVRPVSMTATAVSIEEPFSANSHYPVGRMYHADLTQETRCEVMASAPEPTTQLLPLRLMNPSGPALVAWADVPLGGCALEVYTPTGVRLWRGQLEAGAQQVRVELPTLAAGLYLVRLHGDDWSSKAVRWVVVR